MGEITELRVVLVSPGDVAPERAAVRRAVEEVNRGLASTLRLHLSLILWELDSRPGLHADGPQGRVDHDLRIEDADLVVGIFWHRLGTPVTDAPSGTVHELRQAWELWAQVQRPEVMLYFKNAPYLPAGPEDLQQWKQVFDLQASLPSEQMYWSFEDEPEFERLLREHLASWLSSSRRDAAPPTPRLQPRLEEYLLQPPYVANPSRSSDFDREFVSLQNRYSVVAVEGIPGIGKTSAVAQHLTASPDRVAWYSVQDGDSLDDLLTVFSGLIPVSSTSPTIRCRQLLYSLAARDTVLVIDDFHLLAGSGGSTLLAAASASRPPANVVLLSREHVEPTRAGEAVGHLRLSGYSERELHSFLRGRGIDLPEQVAKRLLAATDGLPLAVSIFATLVVELGRDPVDLLDKVTSSVGQLRAWFDELIAHLPGRTAGLLAVLSFSEGPFNAGVVDMAETLAGASEGALETLQRSFLVQQYGPFRWTTHSLVSQFCRYAVKDDLARVIHRSYAAHLRRGVTKTSLMADSNSLLWSTRACRHLQDAREVRQSASMIETLAGPLKAAGWWTSLSDLSRRQLTLKPEAPATWITYP